MTGTTYCYLHAFGRMQRVPWHKNPTVHFFVGLGGILASLYFYLSGPTASVQQEIRQNVEGTAKNVDEIRRLLATIAELDQKRQAELRERFPLGYVLFGIDHKEVVIPYMSRLTSELDVNLEGASLLVGEDDIVVSVPRILDRKREIYLHDFGIGASRQIGFRGPVVSYFDMDISLAVLADYGSSVVCALGFSERRTGR